jgi:hypothetical protein
MLFGETDAVVAFASHRKQRLRYDPIRLMGSLDLWRWYANITIIIVNIIHSQSQSYLITNGQSDSLSWYQDYQDTIWDSRPILLSLGKYFRIFWFSSFGAPFLTTGRVYNLLLQVLLGIARVVTVGSKLRNTRDHILLYHLRLGSLFVTSYDRQGYGGSILTRLRTGWSLSIALSFI